MPFEVLYEPNISCIKNYYKLLMLITKYCFYFLYFITIIDNIPLLQFHFRILPLLRVGKCSIKCSVRIGLKDLLAVLMKASCHVDWYQNESLVFPRTTQMI